MEKWYKFFRAGNVGQLIRQSRLSVAHVREDEWRKVLEMAGK